MTVSQTDWRLQGQEKYLKGLPFKKKKYMPYREGWEHDHCEFCSAKFSLHEAGCLTKGYATSDNYRWVCEPCFNDFREFLQLKEEDHE